MLTKVTVALCLFGLALAAEDNSTRKSRQIIHPLVPLVGEHHGHNLYSLVQQPHILTPSTINYVQPAVPSVVLPQPLSVPFPNSLHHPEFYQSAFHSTGPQAFNGPANAHYVPSLSGHYHHDQHYNHGHQYQHNQHYPQGAQHPGFSFGRQQSAFRQQSAPVNENNGESNQFDASTASQRQGFPQASSNNFNGQSSFQSLVTPSQDSNEEQRFSSGSPLNQNIRGSSPSAEQSSDFSQSQSSGLSAYRPSPRLYGPSPIIAQYPTSQQSGNSQDSSQSSPNSNQQQTSANIQGSFGQQRSGSSSAQGPLQSFGQQRSGSTSVQGPLQSFGQQRSGPSSAQDNQQQQNNNGYATPILSQSGQIRHDGSYTYGFYSANGIQSTESGAMRPEGLNRYVEGSYSYTAPDGTPISAQYYADETGFHVRGDHIPASGQEDVSRNFQSGNQQFQQQGPAVQSN